MRGKKITSFNYRKGKPPLAEYICKVEEMQSQCWPWDANLLYMKTKNVPNLNYRKQKQHPSAHGLQTDNIRIFKNYQT